MLDGLIGILASVLVGSLLAVAVAVALSPLAPIGPVRPVYPTPGVAYDWTVLGLGVLVLIVVLGSLSVVLAYRGAPQRVAARRRGTVERSSVVVQAAATSGLPAPTVAGVRFALEPGTGRNAVPVRSAILGAVLAIAVVTATFTFGSSLDTLVSRPALYGWNWNYMLLSGFSGDEDLPQGQTDSLLEHDPYVSGFTGVYFDTAADRRPHRPGPRRRPRLPGAAPAPLGARLRLLGPGGPRGHHAGRAPHARVVTPSP